LWAASASAVIATTGMPTIDGSLRTGTLSRNVFELAWNKIDFGTGVNDGHQER